MLFPLATKANPPEDYPHGAQRPLDIGRLHLGGSNMTRTFHAVYENGVLRPTEKVDLPDYCEVEVEVRQVKDGRKKPTLDDVYAVLSERFNTGEPDLAERHNEHQP
jgi:predicted DNA-binding antitoxin AbrB/MazE fold protein